MTAPTDTIPATTGLTAQVREVARLRREHAAVGAFLDERTRVFVEAHADEIAQRRTLGEQLAAAETQLRGAAEAHFRATGEKMPAPGVVIKERTVFAYEDADALAWAKATNMALVPETFDRKALEKIAKVTALEFVTVSTDPKATLATDLDAALATSNGAA